MEADHIADVTELPQVDDDFDGDSELQAFIAELNAEPWTFKFQDQVFHSDFSRLTGSIMLRYFSSSITTRLQMVTTLLATTLGEEQWATFQELAGEGTWVKVEAIATKFVERLNGVGKASKRTPFG